MESKENEAAEAVDDVLVILAEEEMAALKSLSSPIRAQILFALADGPMNVNEIAEALSIPQSTVALNVLALEESGLLSAEFAKAKKGSQKICRLVYREVLIRFRKPARETGDGGVEVSMPVGLYTNFKVSTPCGLCARDSIVGYLDVPESFLSPDRMKAGLLWFELGWVEYRFPNNTRLSGKPAQRIEVLCEIGSWSPAPEGNMRSDITVWINNVEIGVWTSPGNNDSRRGKFSPPWWRIDGAPQHGVLKLWSVTESGSFVDGIKISDVTLGDLDLLGHQSVRVKFGVKEDAEHWGGFNLFGSGFGNYSQDLLLRIVF